MVIKMVFKTVVLVTLLYVIILAGVIYEAYGKEMEFGPMYIGDKVCNFEWLN